MAGKKKKKPAPANTFHCTNCGQPTFGITAVNAANTAVTFCCNCGSQLGANGKCINNACDFFREVPNCGG